MTKDEMLESILHSLERIEARQNWASLTHDEATIIWERVAAVGLLAVIGVMIWAVIEILRR